MSTREDDLDKEIKQHVAIGILQEKVESGQLETNRRLERIENKIDEQHYVPLTAFETYKDEANRAFVTQDQFKPLKWFFYTFGGAVIAAAATAIVAFGLRGGLR
jgi:hypothetical protein